MQQSNFLLQYEHQHMLKFNMDSGNAVLCPCVISYFFVAHMYSLLFHMPDTLA